MNYFILTVFFCMFSTFIYAKTEIYQCKENGSVIFQSKPCKGTGQTVADKVKEQQQAKERKLAEIQEKEKLLQERLKHQPKKEVGFKATIINFKNKMIRYWHALKKKFSIDS